MENKIKLTKGLVINKETITKLQESQMAQIKGGIQEASNKSCWYAFSCNSSCNEDSCNKAALSAE